MDIAGFSAIEVLEKTQNEWKTDVNVL